MKGGRRQVGVPEDLRVVVGVDVDEPGADDLAGRIEHAAALETGADAADTAAGDGDVGRATGSTGAVHHGPTSYDDVCIHPPIVAAPTPRCTPVDGPRPGSDTVDTLELAGTGWNWLELAGTG
jgi:hypothetical protein